MLEVVIRKMLNNKWMVLSLLIGNILLIAMVSSIPVYSDAILQKVLNKELEQYQVETGKYAGDITFEYTSYSIKEKFKRSEYYRINDLIQDQILKQYGVNMLANKVTTYYTNVIGYPEIPREEVPKKRSFRMTSMTDLPDNIQIVQGRMYSNEMQNEVIEVIVTERAMETIDMLLDEVFVINNYTLTGGQEFKVKIVGIFKEDIPDNIFWNVSPSQYSTNIFMAENIFTEQFLQAEDMVSNVYADWYAALDCEDIKVSNLENISNITKEMEYQFQNNSAIKMKQNFAEIINNYALKQEKLNITLWVLQVPIFIILAFFIFMVSKLIVDSEKNEIAVMKSRGASRFQIFRLFLLQTLIILLMSFLVAPQLGLFVCKILGASNGFMELVQRTALDLSLSVKAYVYSFFAATLSAVTMLIPIVSYSRFTIVKHKQSKSRKTTKPIWQRFFLDFLSFGIACYGLNNFNNQKELLAMAAQEASIEPLLFLSSTLFIIGLGLICLRLFPVVVNLVFILGKRIWSPSLYASFIKVSRSAGDEQFIMLFLILTLAMGIFDAKSARSINLNVEEKLKYQMGAEVIIKEKWELIQEIEYVDTSGETIENVVGESYKEPDFTRFSNWTEPEQLTKVYDFTDSYCSISKEFSRDSTKATRVMGIITDEFGRAAWFRNDLEPEHWYNYLNLIANVPNGVLLSRSFEEYENLRVGGTITIFGPKRQMTDFVIMGFVDYWPSYEPTGVDPETGTAYDKNMIIANFTYLQSQWGTNPYEIWIKTRTGDTDFIYSFIEDNEIEVTKFEDLYSKIITNKNDPVFQGTNGVLTVGFIITLLVCMTGFLIYWILSIKSRVLQFGIFRAMGMSMRSVLGMLVNEQILISAIAVGLGIGIGEIASDLFVPLIQLGYSTQDQVLPLKIVIQMGDYVRLFSIVGIMIAIAMIVLCFIISKIKMAQALKLGED